MRRREILKSAGLLAGAVRMAAQPSTGRRTPLAYVASYSSPEGPEGSKGRGEGIYLFEMDLVNGVLSRRGVFPNQDNPSWLAFDRSHTHLYSANETSSYQNVNSGSVSAYSVEPSSGRLTLLNTRSSEGAGPCHLSVHPSGKYLLVANYHGGTVSVLPIRTNGALGPATDVHHDGGDPGPLHATSAPPGEFCHQWP